MIVLHGTKLGWKFPAKEEGQRSPFVTGRKIEKKIHGLSVILHFKGSSLAELRAVTVWSVEVRDLAERVLILRPTTGKADCNGFRREGDILHLEKVHAPVNKQMPAEQRARCRAAGRAALIERVFGS